MVNPFSIVEYELKEAERIQKKITWEQALYDKITKIDATAPAQTFLLMIKLGNLALQHKNSVLNAYIQVINAQIDLIKSYNQILQAGAGNISPAANIVSLLQLLLQQISVGALLTTLGELQGDFRTLANKPLLAYISEIVQATESIKDNNLSTAYNTLKDAYFINPLLILR